MRLHSLIRDNLQVFLRVKGEESGGRKERIDILRLLLMSLCKYTTFFDLV